MFIHAKPYFIHIAFFCLEVSSLSVLQILFIRDSQLFVEIDLSDIDGLHNTSC